MHLVYPSPKKRDPGGVRVATLQSPDGNAKACRSNHREPVKFHAPQLDLQGNSLTEKELLRAMFDLHTRRVHSPKAGNGEAEKPGNT